jgi:hypothetical protein
VSSYDLDLETAKADASTRRLIAIGISAMFAVAVVLVFVTLWFSDDTAQKASLAVLTSVVGVLGTILGYYFAKGD